MDKQALQKSKKNGHIKNESYNGSMDLNTLIKRLGGGAAIARRLGLHRTAVNNWKRAGLPDKVTVRAALLEMADGAVMTAEERTAIRDFLKGPLR